LSTSELTVPLRHKWVHKESYVNVELVLLKNCRTYHDFLAFLDILDEDSVLQNVQVVCFLLCMKDLIDSISIHDGKR
jgi:hypothetical protein